MNGSHNRTMGHPPPRDVQLRDQGRECAQQSGVETATRRFYEDVVARAKANIAEAALEDAEYPER
jgi:hypothetical protein